MDTSLSLLFIFTITSLGVYGVIFGGWASNSKYAFLGAVRSTVQIISYELTLGLILASISLLTGSFNLINIVLYQVNVWNMFTLAPLFLIFLLVILIETNRSPADLPESESELVAGYSVDYSAIGFAMFFLGEYSNMLIMSSLTVILFLGGWLPPTTLLLTLNPNFNLILDNYYVSVFSIKIAFICFYFIWVRATVPRLRYDFLLNLG
jgi:NADH-quinone oxidoreductase subunit H